MGCGSETAIVITIGWLNKMTLIGVRIAATVSFLRKFGKLWLGCERFQCEEIDLSSFVYNYDFFAALVGTHFIRLFDILQKSFLYHTLSIFRFILKMFHSFLSLSLHLSLSLSLSLSLFLSLSVTISVFLFYTSISLLVSLSLSGSLSVLMICVANYNPNFLELNQLETGSLVSLSKNTVINGGKGQKSYFVMTKKLI